MSAVSAKPTATRVFALVTVGGLASTVVAAVAGHVGPAAQLDPFSLTISDYAISHGGGALVLAMVTLAAGSLALLGGMRTAGAPLRPAPVLLLLVWAAGLLVAAAVPTDPPGTATMTVAAHVHRYASTAAFVCLPVAALLLAAALGADPRWARVARAVRWLAFASLGALAVLGYVAFPGDRFLMGMVERVLVLLEIALVAVLAAGLLGTRRWEPTVRSR